VRSRLMMMMMMMMTVTETSTSDLCLHVVAVFDVQVDQLRGADLGILCTQKRTSIAS